MSGGFGVFCHLLLPGSDVSPSCSDAGEDAHSRKSANGSSRSFLFTGAASASLHTQCQRLSIYYQYIAQNERNNQQTILINEYILRMRTCTSDYYVN